MAEMTKDMYGAVGRVGNKTYYQRLGKTIVRTNTRPKNPKTFEQSQHRVLVKAVNKSYSQLKDICNHTFEDCDNAFECMNKFKKVNLKYLSEHAMSLMKSGQTLGHFYQFTPINSEKWTPFAAIISEGHLPVVTVGIDAAEGHKAYVATPGCTYADFVTAWGLQRGDMVARGAKTLEGVDFVINDTGPMELWKRPVPSRFRNRYVVVVDVGGRSDNSDWSVIAVFDRNLDTGDDNRQSRPEVVAQWRGHLDHDELAWKAAQIAFYYNKALLVFESNTLECEGDVGNLIFQQIKAVYPNLYHRKGDDGQKGEPKPGFQTNKKTKQSAIYNLIAYARDGSYIERDKKAVDEMAFYELKPNGKGYGARKGKHDDILMTRAIGLMLIEEMRVNEGRSRAINPNYFVNNLHLSF